MKHEFVKRVYPSNLNYISEKLIKKSKNKNINSLKRNISPNSENNINKNLSNNHSSNHTEITNSQNFPTFQKEKILHLLKVYLIKLI